MTKKIIFDVVQSTLFLDLMQQCQTHLIVANQPFPQTLMLSMLLNSYFEKESLFWKSHFKPFCYQFDKTVFNKSIISLKLFRLIKSLSKVTTDSIHSCTKSNIYFHTNLLTF